MTFCAVMKVEEGLVGISDTRVSSGTETLTAKKISIHQNGSGKQSMFVMTSGLRSARDKALIYFQEAVDEQGQKFNKLYKAVNCLAEQVRRAAKEDKPYLKESGLSFNLNALVAGQLEDDEEHKLYMLYPEGNWVEAGKSSPFFIIGNSGYGKPTFDRVLRYNSSLKFALKVGFLAFDATHISANDVDYPLDVVLYKKNSFSVVSHRFERHELQQISKWWQTKISQGIDELEEEWLQPIFKKMG